MNYIPCDEAVGDPGARAQGQTEVPRELAHRHRPRASEGVHHADSRSAELLIGSGHILREQEAPHDTVHVVGQLSGAAFQRALRPRTVPTHVCANGRRDAEGADDGKAAFIPEATKTLFLVCIFPLQRSAACSKCKGGTKWAVWGTSCDGAHLRTPSGRLGWWRGMRGWGTRGTPG